MSIAFILSNQEVVFMKKDVGIIKEIDRLGRIVIPKDLRDRLALDNEVELIVTSEGILIRNSKYKLVEIQNKKKTDEDPSFFNRLFNNAYAADAVMLKERNVLGSNALAADNDWYSGWTGHGGSGADATDALLYR
jgi:AbrB family looped-hinge helix DNA binding protein